MSDVSMKAIGGGAMQCIQLPVDREGEGENRKRRNLNYR